MCDAQDPPGRDPRSALFLDLDGTLVEIAARPELVRVSPNLPALLDGLARERDGALAVVSGRPLAEIDRLLAPWRGAAAGIHGGERRRSDGTIERSQDPDAARALDRIRPVLAAAAGRFSGVLFEDKGASLAIHYRGAPEHEGALGELARALLRDNWGALGLIHGKMVFEFRPASRHKGNAIAAYLDEAPFRGRTAVFLGDDATDEDGFAEVNRRGGLTIRVGPAGGERSVARFALPSVAAALRWLAAGFGGG